jgi:hypothetical protein
MTCTPDSILLAELAADCFGAARYCPSEAEIGAEYAALAAAALKSENGNLPNSDLPKSELATISNPDLPRRERKPRRPSIRTLIKQAEKATGKPVTSITSPDGTKLDFGKPPDATSDDEAENWFRKHQKKGH